MSHESLGRAKALQARRLGAPGASTVWQTVHTEGKASLGSVKGTCQNPAASLGHAFSTFVRLQISHFALEWTC